MVDRMELDELLDREGLDPDELMTWAHRRAELLLAELSDGSDELARLLEPAGQIDLADVPVRRVAVAEDMLPVGVGAPTARVEDESDESITAPISIETASDASNTESNEPDAAEVGARGRRRVPSTPQPLSASELPPPPEHPRLADGEPEPMLDTFDTGPIDLGSFEAHAMIAATSTRMPVVEPEAAAEVSETAASDEFEVTIASDEPEVTAASDEPQAAASDVDGSDEFEIDELEELDDAELELVDVDDSGDDGEAEAPPPPPPRPPPSRPSQPAAAAPPPKPVDNTVDMDDLIAGLADAD
jgi:hypothetical protein